MVIFSMLKLMINKKGRLLTNALTFVMLCYIILGFKWMEVVLKLVKFLLMKHTPLILQPTFEAQVRHYEH